MDHTLIIGLGNPDPALRETYHNAGALAVEWLAARAAEADGAASVDASPFRPYKGLFEYVKSGSRTFVRPLVYMNESGRAVAAAMRAFSAGPESIVIIHDDSDILTGEFKYATGGGSAGHNGVQSIIDHIHTADFARIRIGIRDKDEVKRRKAGDFVLDRITPADKKTLEGVFRKILAAY